MSKYKININPTAPDKEKVQDYKDFSKVYKMHRRMRSPWWVLRNLYKKPKVRRIAFVVFILLLTLYVSSTYFKNEEERVKMEQLKKESEKLNSIDSHSAPD